MDGSADFEIVGYGNLNDLSSLKFEGEMKLKELKIQPKNFLALLTVDANLQFKENRLDIRSGNIKSDQSGLSFFGVYRRGDSPSLDLNLVGKRLDVDEIFPDSEGEKISIIDRLNQYEFFNKGKGKVKFNLDQLNYKLLNLNQVGGSIVLNNKRIEMKDLTFGANTSLKSGGKC